MSALFKIRGFLPYLIMVFLNAFVDLGHKIIVQNSIFKVYDGQTQIILTAIVNGLILLPFIFLFSPAGFLSDKYPKNQVIKYSAWVAVCVTLMITASYYLGMFELAFALTFLLAIQSAIYSPAKYGYIRELVGDESLATANGHVQATTICAILLGTFVFSAFFEWLLALSDFNQAAADTRTILLMIAPLGWVLVGLSLVELALAYRLPQFFQTNLGKTFSGAAYVSGRYLRDNVRTVTRQHVIWISIIGLSMFWGVSQVVLASFPAYAKDVLMEMNTLVIQGILACAGIGIVMGSVLAGKVSVRHIELGLIPLGAFGIALSLWVMTTLESYTAIIAAFIGMGFFGGLFIVPLNALIQYHAKHEQLGTVLAGSNWVQNVVMISFLTLTAAVTALGWESVHLLWGMVFVAFVGSLYTLKQLPQSFVRIIVSTIFKRRYRMEVVGFDHLPKRGGALLLGNHISWLDWAFVQMACPRPVKFVMLRSIYNKPVLKHVFKAFGAIPISAGTSKEALSSINKHLRAGEVVCLFPEGSISRNGQLGDFRRGYERTIDGVDGVIVPFYLHGLWGSAFSRSSERLQKIRSTGLKRDIIVAFGEPLPITTPAQTLKQKVSQLSLDAWKSYTDAQDPLPLAWLRRAKGQLWDVCVVDAMTKTQLSHGKVLAATLSFAQLMSKKARTSPEAQAVGLMLPASSAAMIANMAVMLNGKTAVNLNYTTSVEAVRAGIANAGVRQVYTSEKFLRKLESRGLDVGAMLEGVEIFLMEELKQQISKARLLTNLLAGWLLPARWLYSLYGKGLFKPGLNLDDPAAILFSSGSEGVPKGVVLSHRNFMSNIKQISDVLDAREEDVLMSSLPPFHSFGLTATTLMPMVEGIPVVCHPDPTDVLNISKAICTYQATILLGTATFLRLYARNRRVEPLMLQSLRIVVAGAEKLAADVRQEFEGKFNKTIYEGYGVTETTPVASVNVPDHLDTDDWKVQQGNKPGTVGLPVPGSCFRIVDPDTLETLPTGEDGLILIAGYQVMLGYLNDPEKTAQVIVELDGQRWYKSGDKGHLDEQGFLTIVDRYSRFAKIGGEMISLTAVEEKIGQILDCADKPIDVLAVNVADAKKGEKVVLLVAGTDDVEGIRGQLVAGGMDGLHVPSEYYGVAAIPVLGTGKKDFKSAKDLALSLSHQP